MYLVDEVLVVVVPHLDLLIVPVLEVGLAPVGVGLEAEALVLVRLAPDAAVVLEPPELVIAAVLVRHPHVVVVRLQGEHAAPVQRGLDVNPVVCNAEVTWEIFL